MYLELNNIHAGYPEKNVIEGLNVRFDEGEFCALIGPNGCGKSTLLKAMIGFLPLQSGRILLDGTNTVDFSRKRFSREIALIPQDFHVQFDYPVEDIVLMGRFPYLDAWKDYTKSDHEAVEAILDRLDLTMLRDIPFSRLSGGEQQRVSIARALAQDTRTILMDESFSHLDINHQLEIMELIRSVNREHGKLVILVSHNINLAANYCPRIVMMKAGKLIADGSPDNVINGENLHKLFGIDIPLVTNPHTGHPLLTYPG